MKEARGSLAVASLAVGLTLAAGWAVAEDIDIFVGGTEPMERPNILIVLDNTSNWARQSQQWPGGLQQGQSEVRAIKNALANVVGQANVGVFEFVTQGNANDDGGYVRHDIQTLTVESQGVLNGKLDAIFNDINGPIEKRNSNTPYGNLMYDVYNYLGGFNSFNGGAGTPSSRADAAGYSSLYSRFESPLTDSSICGTTYVIFVTNPNASGPATDSNANSATLRALIQAAGGTADKLAGDTSGTALPIPNFTTSTILSDPVNLGTTTACYKNSDCAGALAAEFPTCSSTYNTCTCTQSTFCSGSGTNATFRQSITGQYSEFVVEETTTFNTSSGSAWNLDDWAKFLQRYGVPFTTANGATTRIPVVMYTIDVFNKQQNAQHTGLMMSTAKQGGGRYFAARSEQQIQVAIETALSEILAVNSSFASASLPVSATNRTQNENQVFIPMFRPDRSLKPRWFGNMKRYQVGQTGSEFDLVDSEGKVATNTLTGFVSECAVSFWTTNTDDYWEDKNVTPAPRNTCLAHTWGTDPFSDLPDGAYVEKGAASGVLRSGNGGTAGAVNRTVYTLADGQLAPFKDNAGGLATDLINFVFGHDADDEDGDNDRTEPRSTIHGDVVHSRPVPINYGGNAGVTVFYGANDGMLRALDAATGRERWAFVAPEHFSKLERLKTNAPLISFPIADGQEASRTPKDYFFDGAIGSTVRYDASSAVDRAWIYPTMRRGGRMIYALDVTDPAAPDFMWRKGCPNLTDDTGCTDGFSQIGQTWSIPRVGSVKGYHAGARPIVVTGGGYDACEDADSKVVSCASTKGNRIFIMDAEAGTLLATFTTERAVAADISLVDTNFDGMADYAYAADTGGAVYRVAFVDQSGAALAPDAWTSIKIASTTGGARKFLYGPAVFPYQGHVYLALGSGNRERPLETNYPYGPGDAENAVDDRFYVFLDRPTTVPALGLLNLDGNEMHDRSSPTVDCTAERVLPSSTQRGWYMSLPGRGEQTVTSAIILSGLVAFNTNRPGSVDVGGNVCVRPLGVAQSYWVNLLNGSGAVGVTGTCGGTRSSIIAGGGLPPSPIVATVLIDGKPQTIAIGVGSRRDAGPSTPFTPVQVPPTVNARRTKLYWSSEVDK